ncbi:DUF222 domain-containing protein [Microbacterium sp. A93]|uniref:HNH endonuclease signature motif containing protein n=1 Tax=Microbacterium sp. A93 TaxID=3450716 RepID=UPI003F443316
MTSLAAELENIDRQLADAMTGSTARGGVRLVGDGELVDIVQVLGRIQRRLDGAIVEATDRVVERDQCERDARLTTQLGCRDAAELLRRTLLIDGPAARRYVSAVVAVHRDLDITSGNLLPAPFPELSAALAAGAMSLSGFLACTTPLLKARRLGTADRLAADAVLARFATGRPLDSDDADDDASGACETAPLPTTDELAGLTAHIIDRLDPDGAEPKDRAGKRRRYFTIGRLRDGSVPVRGELLPEVAAQLEKLIDSLMNPKVDDESSTGAGVRFRPSDDGADNRAASDGAASDGADADDVGADNAGGTGEGSTDDGDRFDAKYSTATDAASATEGDTLTGRADGLPPHKAASPPPDAADLRTHAQKRHDAFASIIMVAAASDGMPTLGGAAPTLVVSVSAEDYLGRTGRATVEGAGYDVPLGAAAHAACAGGVERVLFDENGAIVGISTTARIFNARQRRAIVLRDRKCLIPGCNIRAEWCEIHHVTEHSHGGPTHTSNGVPLCWHHHRTLDEHIWLIRMRDGTPEIRGPNWWDPYARWRAPHLNYTAVDEAIDGEHDLARNTW